MQPHIAIQKLKDLKHEATQAGSRLQDDAELQLWKGKVRSTLTRALGADNKIVQDFSEVHYDPLVYGIDDDDLMWTTARQDGLRKAVSVIDIAIYELESDLELISDEPVDEVAFDPELWAHVKSHVQNGNWQAVASQTAIFVEHLVRQWSGDPKGRDGKTLVGKDLFAKVFANDSQFRLGKEPSEWEGWRALGTGFTLALSNVDRHNIQKRTDADAKRYAFGVLGFGSLILTQLRYQHSDDLNIEN